MTQKTLRLIWLLVCIALVIGGLTSFGAHQNLTSAQDLATDTPGATVPPTNTVAAPPSITPIPTNTLAPTATATLPAPTLVPPTSMPTLTPTPYTPPEASALATVQTLNRLRVGTIYNGAPFSWLNESGDVEGYEADILRAIGIDLGIDIEFTQVTRQNADEMLLSQRVDIVIGQQVQTRDREALFDFSHPYYINYEMMVVLTDAPFNALTDFSEQPVAVEIGSRSERALRNWMAQTGIQVDVRTFFTEEAALDALAAGEVSGMVGPLDSLRRAGRQGMRLIDEPVLTEYYSIVMRRYDVNLRNLLNRSIQRLKASGRLEAMFADWFAEDPIDFVQLIPIYDLLFADTRELSSFPIDMPYLTESVVDRIARGEPLRVSGLVPFGQDAPNAQFRVMNAFNDALIQEMARRWNVQIELVPGAPQNGVDLVANGLADIAVGVTPRWDGADRVEYSQPYILHGDRLAVPTNSQVVNGFQDMLGTGWWIGYFADDAPDGEKIRAIADFFGVGANIRDPFAIQNEDNALYTMTVENNLDAVFGDNLRLYGLIQDGYTNSVRVIETPMGDELPIAFALPRNDADFRSLVNATLQDMAQDGTFQRLWAEHFGFGDPIPIRYYAPVSPDVKLQ